MSEAMRRNQMVRSGEVELWAEAAGPTEPVVLLLPGADASSRRWPDEELDALLAAGCGIIRFDPRDTGRSTVIAETDLYTLDDLAADAVAVLDAFGVAKAVIIGHSMGGMVAQILALEHPERVAGLVLIATTPGADDDRLPGPTDDVVTALAELRFEPIPRTPEAAVDWLVRQAGILAGDDLDAAAEHARASAEVAWGWRAETGHGSAVYASPSRLDHLGAVQAPTVVLHGTDDAIYPLAHGEALAARIPGATLVRLDGAGHTLADQTLGRALRSAHQLTQNA